MKSFLILSVWSCVLCLLCGCAAQHSLININIGVLAKAPTKVVQAAPQPMPDELYRVNKGDCLWSIAGKVYDDSFRWPELWKANIAQIQDPDLIYVDQVLTVSTKDEVVTAHLIASRWPKYKGHKK